VDEQHHAINMVHHIVVPEAQYIETPPTQMCVTGLILLQPANVSMLTANNFNHQPSRRN
jgi:hypothetical protein